MKRYLILVGICLVGLAGLTFLAFGPVAEDGPPGEDDRDPGFHPAPESGTAPTEPGEGEGAGAEPAGPGTGELVEMLVGGNWSGDDPLGAPAVYEFVSREEGLSELLDLVRGAGREDHKAAALLALGWSRDPRARSILAAASNGELGAGLRTAALYALSREDPEHGFPLLRDIALRSRDELVYGTAMQSLMMLDPYGSLEILAEALDRSAEDPRRREIVLALLAGLPFQTAGEEPEFVREYRSGLLHLFEAMPETPPEFERSVREIAAHAARERDPRVMRSAGAAVLRIPGEAAERAFGELWAAGDQDLRMYFVSRIDPGRPSSKLVELTRRAPDSRLEVRETVSLLLDAAPDPRLLAPLRAWRDREENAVIRERLEKAVKRLGR